MKKKIIIDCDNTFSVDGCDIDDGLAIIYTLSEKNTEVLGISTTFGNNKLDTVYENTKSFMNNIGHSSISVYKGEEETDVKNEAAEFLSEMADKYPGELSVLATGSLTNLYSAWKMDNTFYEKIKEISLMGGITEHLLIKGKVLNELNFSCDLNAALNVLQHGKSIEIATGNTCLDGFFQRKRFEKLKGGNKFEKWLYKESKYWFDREKDVFKNDGIYLWDIFSAAALLKPDLFIKETLYISPDIESMKSGMLIGNGKRRKVTVPKIRNTDEYIEHVYKSFKDFGEKFTI